ncbi:coiled-coil domain-containing protein 57 [Protopterus annectens]|uniref:coiled-coil domain-containing protein 57 n=1 Tax=Protopterus annectens TaxID=7888 RepID=UPI001CF982D5|nr:coiled-coil domain-containing protein 57 [Protopterus annectens]
MKRESEKKTLEFFDKDPFYKMHHEKEDLDDLLARKEREWKDLQKCRVRMLETALQEAKLQVGEQQEKMAQLKEDFKYNLKVLEERDRELERYDLMFSQLKMVESTRQNEISDLRIQIDKLQNAVSMETKAREELQQQYQQRVKEHQLTLERLGSMKDMEIEQHRAEYEKLKQELERRILEVEGDLPLQKQEMMTEFDAEIRRREHEFRLQMDGMSNAVLSSELKVKLLTKELEILRESGVRAAESLEIAEANRQELEKEIQRKEREKQDLTVVKDSCIKELGGKLHILEQRWEKEKETFQRKHQELDRHNREKDAVLNSVKQAHSECTQELENQIKELQIHCETLEMEKRRLDWNHSETLKEKEETISKYREQLSLASARERILEQAKVQAELDWQSRCDAAERTQYEKSEQLIEQLTVARDQVAADLKEKIREVQDLETLVQTLTLERDEAVMVLQTHGIIPERDNEVSTARPVLSSDTFASNEIRKLQQQNTSLRAVIAEMRREMEQLSEQIGTTPNKEKQSDRKTQDVNKPATTPRKEGQGSRKQIVTKDMTKPDSASACESPEYVRDLENEVKQLKIKCRQLSEKLEDAYKATKQRSSDLPEFPVSADNIYLQNHIRLLNETIGALRAEKVANAAAMKKLEARAAFLDGMVTKLSEQVRAKEIEMEKLRYELTTQQQRSNFEISSLNERITGLELQLAEARKEVDEYFKGNLEQNLETVALGNEVAALKLGLASRHVPVVAEQSETVKQLQEEVLHLRQQIQEGRTGIRPSTGNEATQHLTATVQVLKQKLKSAVRHLSQLSQEKQQLIEMGNRLRAELIKAGLDALLKNDTTKQSVATFQSSVVGAKPPKELGIEAQSRLSELEHLQYELTKQEIQYVQRGFFKGRSVSVHCSSSESENGGKIKDTNPWEMDNATQKAVATKDWSRSDNNLIASSKKENRPPDFNQPQNVPGMQPAEANVDIRPHSSQSQPLASSFGGNSSLQDIWEILDRGSSPSVCTPRSSLQAELLKADGSEKESTSQHHGVDDHRQRAQQHFSVQGIRTDLLEKVTPSKPVGKTTLKLRNTTKSAKIRNYNIRD